MDASPGLASRLRRLVPAGIGSFLVRPGAAQMADARWNADYADGAWDSLDSLFEMPRYAVITGYCRQVAERGAPGVLDIGCGSGVLHRWLSRDGLAGRYRGIDLSSTAIDQARAAARAEDGARFAVADAERFTPENGERFGVIVLNEMLYYLTAPAELVRRCASFLDADGAILLSMWRSPHALAAWRKVAPLLEVQDEIRLRRPLGLDGRPARDAEWHIRLCRPRAG